MPPAVDDRRTFRVLIVDDDASVRTFVERVLRQPAYDTRVAADGAEALSIAATAAPFDLLLTDLAMPGMSGDELARRLRYSNPGLKVLYLTGYSDRLFDTRAVLWEDEAFLDKPVTLQGVLEAVSLLLVGRIPAPRSVRVRVPGARVHVADAVADLETLSVTGALIHAVEDVPVGSTWPLVLELPTDTIRLTARVVNCEPQQAVASDPAALPTPYKVALAFVEPSAGVRRVLQRVCGDATAAGA